MSTNPEHQPQQHEAGESLTPAAAGASPSERRPRFFLPRNSARCARCGELAADHVGDMLLCPATIGYRVRDIMLLALAIALTTALIRELYKLE